MHVYLEGDGTPWLRGRDPAVDPTPREPMALRWMAVDPRASVLLGRPCYHGYHAAPPCRPALWTSERYSEAVVASMSAALSKILEPSRRAVLIGYSGGGPLAMLLAERVPGVEAVVSVAANLDVEAWVKLHGYEPLAGSLNPAARPPLPRSIRQIHIAGAEDKLVPPELVARFAARQPGARFRALPGQDHSCCWTQAWPALLRTFEVDMNGL